MSEQRAVAQTWVDGYVKAWRSNDPSDIRAVFTEDIVYFRTPGDPPWVGIEAVVAAWQEHVDDPADTRFDWSLVAVDGEVAVVRGVTTYPDHVFDNLWLVRLAPDGRASEFTDFWNQRGA